MCVCVCVCERERERERERVHIIISMYTDATYLTDTYLFHPQVLCHLCRSVWNQKQVHCPGVHLLELHLRLLTRKQCMYDINDRITSFSYVYILLPFVSISSLPSALLLDP